MSGATGDLRISGGYNATNAYGKANFIPDPSFAQVQWDQRHNPFGDFLTSLNTQARTDAILAGIDMAEKELAYRKEQDVIDNAHKDRVFNADRDDEMFKRNGISAEKKAELDLRSQEMANSRTVARINASAGRGQDDIQKAILARQMNAFANEYQKFLGNNPGATMPQFLANIGTIKHLVDLGVTNDWATEHISGLYENKGTGSDNPGNRNFASNPLVKQ